MKCQKCNNPINSKKDLTIGYLWSYFWLGVMAPLALFHKKCFDEVKSKTMGVMAPASIDLNKLNSIKVMSYVVITIDILFIVFAITNLYLKRNQIDWADFFNVGTFGYFSLVLGLVFFVAIFYFPIRNLVIINELKKLN